MNKFILILFFSIFIINLTNAYDLPPKCKLPKIVGPCLALIPRWWYDNGECKEFDYGGCKGNANNFETLQECQENCNICYLPKVVGPCDAYFERWWYNNGECKKFIYGGCGSNGNNFETLEECQKNCNATDEYEKK